MRYNRRVADWIKLRCGDTVRRRDNPRHVGLVRAIFWASDALVEWGNGWREEVPIEQLERINA